MEKRLIENEIRRHRSNIRRLEKAIAKLPYGKLSHSTRRGKDYFRILQDGKYVYISYKDESEYINKLIVKTVLEQKLADEKNRLEFDQEFLHKIEVQKLLYEELFANHPSYEKILKDYYNVNKKETEDLLKTSITAEPPFPEKLTWHADDGTLVRSKTEGMIYNKLAVDKYVFAYERPIEINGKIYFPDFTIVHPRTKEIIIWEHLGMMSDPEYVKKNMEKIMQYIKAGYIPGVNLIITWESENKSFDSQEMNKVIGLYLK